MTLPKPSPRTGKRNHGAFKAVKNDAKIPKLKLKDLTKADYIRLSLMQVEFLKDGTGIAIRVKGPAGALPSSTRGRHPIRMKDGNVKLVRNFNYQRRLDALTELWKSTGAGEHPTLPLAKDKTSRWFVQIVLPHWCNTMDSNNGCKASCDWLQEVGIIGNDRFVDAFCVKSTDWDLDPEYLVMTVRPKEVVAEECLNLLNRTLMPT